MNTLLTMSATELAAKIKSGENNLGSSYVYGAYASLRFYEPLQHTDYVNTDLKNGETATVSDHFFGP